MPANALIGIGIAIQMANVATPGVKTTIALVNDINASLNAKYDQVDISTYDQGNSFRQFMAGMADPGEFSFDMNFVPNSATDVFLRGKQGQTQIVTVSFSDGTTASFQAAITEYGPNKFPIDGKLVSTCKCKVSGAITWTAASAPVSVIAPSIAATTLVNGGTLTADVGIWAPAANTYTYQWRKNGVNIAGATNSTYVTIAGDVGSGIDVQVTATNGTGSTTAGSVRTANIT